MGKHIQPDNGHHNGHARGSDRDRRMRDGQFDRVGRPRRPRSSFVVVGFIGLALWSLCAGIVYSLVDPALAWIASSAGFLVDGTKEFAIANEAGKDVRSVLDSLDVGSSGQAVALTKAVLKPAIVVVWAIGATAFVAAPFILSRIGRLLVRRRH